MQGKPLTDIAQASPDWLTEVLTVHGTLQRGRVISVTTEAGTSPHSTNARLLIGYSQEAEGVCPQSLLLKISRSTAEFGTSELDYYFQIAKRMENPPIPHCYHADYSASVGAYHLLLEDLSTTHIARWQGDPSLANGRSAIDSLAHLHAHWWNHPELPAIVGEYPTAETIERYLDPARQGLLPLIAEMGAELSIEDRNTLERVFERQGALMIERAKEQSSLTCIHGDPNPGNVLSPLEPDGRAYLIDRQPFDWSLVVWTGASDLAYMMVHWWEPERRRTLEKPLLDRYLQQLEARGVRGYSLEALWYDYRLSAMQSLYVATEWCRTEADIQGMKWVWLPQLRKTLIALRELDCLALLN